jgi:hypothetical protein
MRRLRQWCADATAAGASDDGTKYRFVFVDQKGFERHPPKAMAGLAASGVSILTMSDGYELSDAEKRDLNKLITEGKPLPEKYRFLLFHDDAAVWNVRDCRSHATTTLNHPNETANGVGRM